MRIFSPLTKSYVPLNLSDAHRRNKNEKSYAERFRVEYYSFTPDVFSCFDGMTLQCEAFYRRHLKNLLVNAMKSNERYSKKLNIIVDIERFDIYHTNFPSVDPLKL